MVRVVERSAFLLFLICSFLPPDRGGEVRTKQRLRITPFRYFLSLPCGDESGEGDDV
jgi:hypothetical protein